eukprot:12883884-Prorocentrum_lima.AAC.1
MRNFMCCSRLATWVPRATKQQGWRVALAARGECGFRRWSSTGCCCMACAGNKPALVASPPNLTKGL